MMRSPATRPACAAGPLFATSRYDDYFYSVAPQFATANRPAYQAHGGYAGTEFLTSLSKRYDSYWVGTFARYDTLAGASFVHSPLVKSRSYWTAGIGIAWTIRQSSRLVEAEDEALAEIVSWTLSAPEPMRGM